MQKLKGFHKNQRQHEVKFKIDNTKELINIEVEVIQGPCIVSDKFKVESYDNWGLWDFDVVEVFLGHDKAAPYIELQTSPKNQWFGLKILEPRKNTCKISNYGNTKITGIRNEFGFSAQFIVDRSIIPGNGSGLYGNITACLGPKDARCFYGMALNTDENPDFHLPELFIDLDKV